MNKHLTLTRWFLTFALTNTLWAADDQPSFELSGSIQTKAYADDGREFLAETYQFEVAVSGRQWFIRTHYSENHSVEYGSDGTNTFEVLLDYTVPGSESSKLRPGMILPGPYPLVSEGSTALAWLVFCSSPIFSESGTAPLILPPWLDPTADARAHALRSEVTLSPDPPHLPGKVVFTVDAQRLATAASDPALFSSTLRNEQSGSQFSSLEGLPEGFVAGEVEVISWTNIGNINVPLTFKATQRAFPEPGREGGSIFAEYLGRVDSVKTEKPRSSYLPEISKWKIAVGDYRFNDRKSNVDYINYPVENGVWPAVANDELLALFDKRKAALKQYYKKPLVGRVWVLALLLLVLVVPAFRLIQRNKK